MTIALIALTHSADQWQDQKVYKGRVLLDASQIESIEEILVDGEAPVSYVTLQSGCAHTVSESPWQIMELMGQALNQRSDCGGFTATWSPQSAVSAPDTRNVLADQAR